MRKQQQQKISNFQKRLMADKATMWKIVKMFHPDLDDSHESKLQAHPRYHWVCIDFDVTNYGTVSIGVDNGNNPAVLMGPDITKEQIKAAIKSGKISMQVWRFANDSYFKKNPGVVLEPDRTTLSEAAVSLLKARGYLIQTADEFYYWYHKS
jgi:hypothetical protein